MLTPMRNRSRQGIRTLARVMLVMLAACGPSDAQNQQFLDDAAAEQGAIRTESGLVYLSLAEGDGTRPGPSASVTVDYVGRFTDGAVFDRGEGLRFGLGAVIACFREGLQRMAVGGRARLTCPPALAYGSEGQGPIPGNAVLQFEVTLLDVR